MKPDDFESGLQRHAIRSIPEHWRGEILKAANARKVSAARGDWLRAFGSAVGYLLSPNRQSWCAVAATWAVILFLHTSASEPSRKPTARASEIQQTALHFDEQRKLLSEILNDAPAQVADRPKLKGPELRGQCSRELIFA